MAIAALVYTASVILMIHVHLEKSLAAFLEIQVDIQNCIFIYSF